MRAPDVTELLLAEAHRGPEDPAADRTLVAELDDLADDGVEVRDSLERGRSGAVGGVLVGLGRDALELIALGRERHAD